MTSLDNLRIFVRSVELGGFSAAGRSLRRPAALVSHHMASLDRDLGCRLLLRTTRRASRLARVFVDAPVEAARVHVAGRTRTPR